MVITTKEIEQEIKTGFQMKYKAFSGFPDSGQLWKDCIDAVNDANLMNKIIFCNDIHEIPPVSTFLKVKVQKVRLEELERRSLGAFWGYVFKSVFNYQNQRSVSSGIKAVKTATFFYEPQESISVV